LIISVQENVKQLKKIEINMIIKQITEIHKTSTIIVFKFRQKTVF